MKLSAYTFCLASLLALLAAGLAQAGFQHPIEQSGAEALAIQSTPIHPGISSSAQRMMPDRRPGKVTSEAMGPVNPAAIKTSPVAAALAATWKSLATRLPSFLKRTPKTAENPLPLPHSSALPAAERIAVPNVRLPSAPHSDGLLSMKPESLSLKGSNRAQIHAFLKQARSLAEPKREHGTEVKSRAIAERFRAALSPTPYRSFRTAYQLSIAKISKIQIPGPVAHFENMVKRIDALFNGIDLHYPKSVLALWQLAGSDTNPRNFQARDALFAGILSERAGWEAPAGILLAESASKRVDLEERYLNILWKQLEEFSNPSHIENVVSKVSPHRVKSTLPAGDKANFAMAKRMMFERARAPMALNPNAQAFAEQIQSKALRDRLSLLDLVGQVRNPQESKRAEALNGLKALEASGDRSIRQEARLALARATLQKGSAADALALYRNVEKNGKNRLEVLAEQTYAEYLSGEYQDSLGKSLGLQSPYFQYGFAPDIHLVEILSRQALCDFGGAEAGVQRFNERYARELNAIEATLAKKSAPAAYYEELVSYHELEQPMRYQRFLLQLAPVMANQKTMNQALVDLQKIDTLGIRHPLPERPEGWDGFATSMHDRWGTRALELRQTSAENALREASYLAKRLRHTFAQVELLDLDISTSAAKNFNLHSALNFPAHKVEEAAADKDKFHWPFENEVWEDEIDFMKAKNPSKCAVASAR